MRSHSNSSEFFVVSGSYGFENSLWIFKTPIYSTYTSFNVDIFPCTGRGKLFVINKFFEEVPKFFEKFYPILTSFLDIMHSQCWISDHE